jgi:hypothetical chaperone protein
MPYHAIDFGTSNSLLTFISSEKVITPVPLTGQSGLVLRSLLYTPEKNHWYFGPDAIDEYVNQEGTGRFFRSIKKFLPDPSYSGTVVHHRNMTITDIVAIFLTEMKKRAEKFTGIKVERVILGRPALYSLDTSQDQLAQERMQKAAEMAGYQEVTFCPEPIAAGLDYQGANNKDRIVLIADFGGGTSDFTLMKFHPNGYKKEDILGLSGVFIAGDSLDGVMMKDFISHHFGSRFEYRLPGNSNILKFPRNLLEKICSPAHITHLRERDTWEYLQHITKFALSADDEKKMKNLLTLVECQLGFPLFNEIEKAKVALGKEKSTTFNYHFLDLFIQQEIHRQDYFQSTTPTIDNIMKSMFEVFKQSGLNISDVDQVCLTGGSSQFPLIQDELKKIFGHDKILNHNIYQSVVNGLAQFAAKI